MFAPSRHLGRRCCRWTLYIACVYVWSGSSPSFSNLAFHKGIYTSSGPMLYVIRHPCAHTLQVGLMTALLLLSETLIFAAPLKDALNTRRGRMCFFLFALFGAVMETFGTTSHSHCHITCNYSAPAHCKTHVRSLVSIEIIILVVVTATQITLYLVSLLLWPLNSNICQFFCV